MWCYSILIVLAVVPPWTPAFGQEGHPAAESAEPGCPRLPPSATPTDAQRRDARTLAAQAQQASIVDDNATARDLFRRAVQLDPTDANTAYALARVEDASRDPHAAVAAYCRFLSLAPHAPEADQVRGRVASLRLAETPRAPKEKESKEPREQERTGEREGHAGGPPQAVARAAPSHPAGERSSKHVFLLAAVVPGLGQYYTHRPLAGALVTTAAATALYYGFTSRTVTPVGKTPETRTRYPHLTTGLVVAGGISVLAAVEAALYASKYPRSTAWGRLDVSPSHVAVWFPVGWQGRLAVGGVLTSNEAPVTPIVRR